MRLPALLPLALGLIATPAVAETYYVAEGGDDGAAGTEAAPWATVQRAADAVVAGDVVIVRAGSYAGFNVSASGTVTAPIVFRGEDGAVIDRDNGDTPDGINVEGAAYVVIEGFTVTSATRAGIRAAECDHVTIRDNVADANGRWGIFTAFCDDLLIEGNETSRSGDEHGIYTSNSGDRPVIRGNRVWGNNAAGIHMNGDINFGGDGLISGALVEDNVIYDNGSGGGSAINCDGVQDSTFRNNVIYGNRATGIALYAIDGAEGSRGNLVINNTIVMPGGNRWAILLRDGSTGNTLRNNILWNGDPSRGAIDVSGDSFDGLDSDHNAVISRFTTDDASTLLTLAEWQAATGQDVNSLVATPEELFVDADGDDYQLRDDSPAIDRGDAADAPDHDAAGNARPLGAAVDIGAFERCPPGDTCMPAPPPGGGDGDAGPGDGGELAGGCCNAGGRPVESSLLALACALLLGRRRRRSAQ